MSQEGSIVTLGNVEQKYSMEDFNAVAKTSGFLSRLQLYGANSKDVKARKIGMGLFGIWISTEEIQDLGESVDVAVLAFRPKAMRFNEATNEVVETYDRNDPLFSELQALSDVKDSGAQFGPEFLFYVPSVKKFVTFFMGSKSGRIGAKNVFAQLNKVCTLKSVLVEKGKFSWYAPVGMACSAPPAVEVNEKELAETVEKFLNPPKSEVVKDEAAAAETRER